jgi:hypothetical protein
MRTLVLVVRGTPAQVVSQLVRLAAQEMRPC